MTRRKYLIIPTLIFLCLLFSSCAANQDGILFRYDMLDPLYRKLSETNDVGITFKLDRELMQKASEYEGFIQLSAYQAYCISIIGKTLTPVMQKTCVPVIMLDQKTAAANIRSFEDLLKSNCYVALYNNDSDMVKWLVYAVNAGECRDACILSLDLDFLMKPQEFFPLRFAFPVFSCIATLIDICLAEAYTQKLLIRVISGEDTASLAALFPKAKLNLDNLKEFSISSAAVYEQEEENDALTVRITFVNEVNRSCQPTPFLIRSV